MKENIFTKPIDKNNRNIVKKLYKDSFPKTERFDFELLEECAKESNVELLAIMQNDRVVGMQFIVQYDEITYLMYFAIDKNFRNNGIGGLCIKKLIQENKNLMLCIENPRNKIQQRRKNFYLKNGLYNTNYLIEDTGIIYEYLTSVNGFKITDEILKNRYLKMTSNPVVLEKILKTFDIDIKKV